MSKRKGIRLFGYKDLGHLHELEESLDMVDDEAISADGDSIQVEHYQEYYEDGDEGIRSGEDYPLPD